MIYIVCACISFTHTHTHTHTHTRARTHTHAHAHTHGPNFGDRVASDENAAQADVSERACVRACVRACERARLSLYVCMRLRLHWSRCSHLPASIPPFPFSLSPSPSPSPSPNPGAPWTPPLRTLSAIQELSRGSGVTTRSRAVCALTL